MSLLRGRRGATEIPRLVSSSGVGILPLFSFLEDSSQPARDPVYLSRPINIGPSLVESSDQVPLCVLLQRLFDGAPLDREKSDERAYPTRPTRK